MNCPSVKCGRLFDLSNIYDIDQRSDEMLLLRAHAHQMGRIAQNRAQSGNFPLITRCVTDQTCIKKLENT
jgi:hypothetical protein